MQNLCTTVTVPVLSARIRAAAKIEAHEQALSAYRTQYCGAAVTDICRVNAVSRVVTAVSPFDGGRCKGQEGFVWVSRHLHGQALVSAYPFAAR
jgi:hypothetical protein